MDKEFKFDVFLSHNSEDKPQVELIAKRLKTEFGLNPFLDKWNLIPGKTWPEELERALDESATTAIFLGTGGKGPWHDQEMQRALVKAVKTHEEYRIIPVLLPWADESEVSGFLGLRTWVKFRGSVDDEEALKRLVGGIKGEAIDSGGFELADELAPYRGLSRFEKDQADLFFGRGDDIKALVARLGSERFVAVVGASGSGKSSLVRAGLLPRLEKDALPGSSGWRVIVFLPGREPLRALANQLVLELPKVERLKAADELVTRFAKSETGIGDTLANWYAESPAPLLLVIDQFEELFTQCSAEAHSSELCREAVRRFIAGVSDLLQSGGGDVRVVITLRADFLDRCLEFPALRALLQDHQLLLGELGEEALREAIVMPAQRVGAFFEKGLVNLILRDVTGEHGSLPLLQHALFELWKARRGPWLTLEAYENSGGVTGALKRFAQRIYEGFNPGEQEIARHIFVRITSLGDGVSDTRRRVERSALYPKGVDATDVDRVIERLSGKDARLIVVGEEGVEVTHESLLQEWDTLRGWLNEDRDAQRLRQQITEAAQLWVEAGRNEDDLYKGARLELAEKWEEEHPDLLLVDLEEEFLDASRTRRVKEQESLERDRQEKEMQRQKELKMAKELAEKERLRAEEKAASAQRLKKRAFWLGLATVVAVIFMAGAIWYWHQAELASKEAQEKTVQVEQALKKVEEEKRSANNRLAKYFLTEAERLQSEKPQLSLLLGIEAMGVSDLPSVESGFRKILGKSWGLPLIGHEGVVRSVAFDPRPSKVARLASAGSDGSVRVWDLNIPGTEPLVLRGHIGSVRSVAFDSHGTGLGRLASAAKDGTVRVWDLESPGSEPQVLRGHEGGVFSVAFDPRSSGGGRLASAGDDGTVRVWDLNAPGTEPLVLRGHIGTVRSVAFDPHGTGLGRLASAGKDGKVRVWDLNNPGTEPQVLQVSYRKRHAYSVAFDPSSSGAGRLASAWGDGAVRIWDLNAPGVEPVTLRGHQPRVVSVAFDPRGRRAGRLASAGSDGTVRVWDLNTPNREPQVLRGHQRGVVSVAFDPQGPGVGRLASAGDDGIVQVWDLNGPGTEPMALRGHSGGVLSVAFDPRTSGGGRLASTGWEGTVRVWDLDAPGTEPQVLRGHRRAVRSVAFDPRGSGAGRLASAGSYGTVRVWDLNTLGDEPLVLRSHKGVVRSVAFDPHGTGAGRLASAGDDGMVRVWDLNAPGAEPQVLHGHEGPILSLAFDPRGSGAGRLASAGFDGTVRIWDLNTPAAEPLVLRGDRSGVVSVAFDPQGSGMGRLAGAGEDGTVHVWNLNALATEPRVLRGHKGTVWSVAFDPRRSGAGRLASAGSDGTVRVWDLNAQGGEPQVLFGDKGGFRSVAFDPQGSGAGRLATGAESVQVWSLGRSKLADQGCRLAGRNLAPSEWNKYFEDTTLHLTCDGLPLHRDYLKRGQNLAFAGDIDGAIAEFTEVLARFGTGSPDPKDLAHRYAAYAEVKAGNELARSGDAAAEVHYRRAVELDPSWRIIPAKRVAEIASWAKVEEGDRLVRNGDRPAAISAYEQALDLYPTRRVNPSARAERIAAGVKTSKGD